MNYDIKSRPQAVPKPLTGFDPRGFERGSGCRDVGDRGVEPVHVPLLDLATETRGLERRELVVFNKGQDRCSSPVCDHL